jgi:hypothetical protein
MNKILKVIKKLLLSYKRKFIETPIKEKHADLKEKDVKLYENRVKNEVEKTLALQYFLPATIITLFLAYAIFTYIQDFIHYLGGF